jgi:predicted methyltransferase
LVSWAVIEKIANEERKVFTVEGGEIRAVQIYSEVTGWVRTLCATQAAPTVLVSGIPMHRIKDTDPVQDTREKMKALGVQKGRVLDTATGLGYTAIAAARMAKEVVTIELDPAAIELARLNPWSRELFTRSNVTQMIGDALEILPELPSVSFSAVIHDPPTMSLGGELYSEDFYRELKRVMTRGGRLFHYICDPDSGLGKRLWPGVMKRLSHAGFGGIERHPQAFGITARS